MKKGQRLENLISQFLLEGSKYLFSFLTVPLLYNRLSTDSYAKIIIFQALYTIVFLIINYGFSISGVRNISLLRNDKQKLNQYFSDILSTRLFISFLITSLILLMMLLNGNWIYLFLIPLILSESLSPVIYYQGVERMKIISGFNVLSRFIILIIIFFTVKKDTDLIKVLIGISIIPSILNIIFFIYFKNSNEFKYKLSTYRNIFKIMRNEGVIFLSQINSLILSVFSTLFLGFVNDLGIVFFSVAVKIMRLSATAVAAISNTFLPYTSAKFDESLVDGKKLINKILIFGSGLFILIMITFIFFPDYILKFLKLYSHESCNILRIISVVPLLVFLNTIIGIHGLINLGYKNYFTKITFIGSTALIIFSLLLYKDLNIFGMAISILIAEISMVILMVYKYIKIK